MKKNGRHVDIVILATTNKRS